MTAASSLCHRKCRAIPLIVLLTMAPALTACGSTHHLAEQQTTAPSAANEDAATQTSGPRVPDRRTRAVVSCDDLDADPLRGLSDEEPACIPSVPRTKTPREECPDICLNVIIVEVDEDNWKVVKVQVLNERDKSRPAIVHRRYCQMLWIGHS